MNFLNELIIRLFSSKPWFFQVVQIISVATAVVTGLPEFLADSGIHLPEALEAISSKAVSIAAMVAAFVSQLTVTDKTKKENGLKD